MFIIVLCGRLVFGTVIDRQARLGSHEQERVESLSHPQSVSQSVSQSLGLSPSPPLPSPSPHLTSPHHHHEGRRGTLPAVHGVLHRRGLRAFRDSAAAAAAQVRQWSWERLPARPARLPGELMERVGGGGRALRRSIVVLWSTVRFMNSKALCRTARAGRSRARSGRLGGLPLPVMMILIL
jgi:hypothetical protein